MCDCCSIESLSQAQNKTKRLGIPVFVVGILNVLSFLPAIGGLRWSLYEVGLFVGGVGNELAAILSIVAGSMT